MAESDKSNSLGDIAVTWVSNFLRKIFSKGNKKKEKRNIDTVQIKKSEILFRNEQWFSFMGNLYRNTVEIPSVLKNFKIDPSDTILDVGAGSGRFTREFKKITPEVLAADLSVESLKTNKTISRSQVVVCDICYLPFKSSVFDKVAAISVLQHLPSEDRKKAVLELKRILKENSEIIIEVFNYRLFPDILKKNGKEGFFRTRPPLYFYRFNASEFKSFIRSFFSEIKDFRCMLFFQMFMSGKLGEKPCIVKMIATLEAFIEKTIFSRVLGDRIIVVCEK